MGVGYILVNQTRRECVMFMHVNASKARELAGNPAAAAITTWYLLHHRGDAIAFVSDTYEEWPFSSGSYADLNTYSEVTDRVVDELIRAEILADHGKSYVDEDEPERVFIRDLRNVWWPAEPG